MGISEQSGTRQVLANLPAHRLRLFLERFANRQNEVAALARLRSAFPEFVQGLDWLRDRHIEGYMQGLVRPGIFSIPANYVETGEKAFFAKVQNWLRSIWIAEDMRIRVYLTVPLLISAALKRRVWKVLEPGLDPFRDAPVVFPELPTATPFEQAIWYLVERKSTPRFCESSGCSEPYFFAVRRSQKFCRPECAAPSKREAKRRWWTANRGSQKKPRRQL